MFVLSIAIQKGGTGKTTTAWALGGELRKRGYRVLSVDLDSQGSLTMIMGGTVSGRSSYELIKGDASPASTVQSTPQGDLIPGSPRLSIVSTTGEGLGSLRELDSRYDIAILDCPPGAGPVLASALMVSDGVLIPSESDAMSIRALTQISKLISSVKERNSGLRVLGVVPTRWTGRTVLSRTVSPEIEARAREMGSKVLPGIRPCIAVQEAQAGVSSLQEYAPRATATKDYEDMTDRIMEQIEGKKGRKKRY